jgi:hypothetical protein
MNVIVIIVDHPNEFRNMINCAGVMQLQADYVESERLIVLLSITVNSTKLNLFVLRLDYRMYEVFSGTSNI